MKRKTILQLSFFGLALTVLLFFVHIHLHIEKVKFTATCIDKTILYDRHGELLYLLEYRHENGELASSFTSKDDYYATVIGGTCTITHSSFNWK